MWAGSAIVALATPFLFRKRIKAAMPKSEDGHFFKVRGKGVLVTVERPVEVPSEGEKLPHREREDVDIHLSDSKEGDGHGNIRRSLLARPGMEARVARSLRAYLRRDSRTAEEAYHYPYEKLPEFELDPSKLKESKSYEKGLYAVPLEELWEPPLVLPDRASAIWPGLVGLSSDGTVLKRAQTPGPSQSGMEEKTLQGVREVLGLFVWSHQYPRKSRQEAFGKAIQDLSIKQLLTLYHNLVESEGERSWGWRGRDLENQESRDTARALAALVLERLRSGPWNELEGVDGVLHRLIQLALQKGRPREGRIRQAQVLLSALKPGELSELLDLYDQHPLNEYGRFQAESDLRLAEIIRGAMRPRGWIEKIATVFRPVLHPTHWPTYLMGVPVGFFFALNFLRILGMNDRDSPVYHWTELEHELFWWGSIILAYPFSLLFFWLKESGERERMHREFNSESPQFTFPEHLAQVEGRRVGVVRRTDKDPKGAGDSKERQTLVLLGLGTGLKDDSGKIRPLAEKAFLSRPDMEYHLARSLQRWVEQFPTGQSVSLEDYPLGQAVVLQIDMAPLELARREALAEQEARDEAERKERERRREETRRRERAAENRAELGDLLGRALGRREPTSLSAVGQQATSIGTPVMDLIPEDLNLDLLTEEQLRLFAEEVAKYLGSVIGPPTGGPGEPLSPEQVREHQQRIREIFNWIRRRPTGALGFQPLDKGMLLQLMTQRHFEGPVTRDGGAENRFRVKEIEWMAQVEMSTVVNVFGLEKPMPVFIVRDVRDEKGDSLLDEAGGFWTQDGTFVSSDALLSRVNATLARLHYVAGPPETLEQAWLAKAYPEAGTADPWMLRWAVVQDALESLILHEAAHHLSGTSGTESGRPADPVNAERASYLAPILFGSNRAAQVYFLLGGTDPREGSPHRVAVNQIKEALMQTPSSLEATLPLEERGVISPLEGLYRDSNPPLGGQQLLPRIRQSLNLGTGYVGDLAELRWLSPFSSPFQPAGEWPSPIIVPTGASSESTVSALEEVPLAQPVSPVQEGQVPEFVSMLQNDNLVGIDGYTYFKRNGEYGGEIPFQIIQALMNDPRGVQPGEKRVAILLDKLPGADRESEISHLYDQLGVPPNAVPQGVEVVSAVPEGKAWENPQAVDAIREKVSRDITDLDAFLVDASQVTVEGVSAWVRPGVKATIVRISPASLNVLLTEKPEGEDVEALLRAAHAERGKIFDVEKAVIVNYEGYRIAILRAA